MGKYFDEFSTGEKFETIGRTVTETDVVIFSTLTGAYNPMFLNEEYGKKTIFKGRIAPGMLTLSLATALMYQLGFLDKTLIALLGVDEVRFPSAVKLGDTVKLVAEVVEKKETGKKDRGIVVIHGTCKNQKDESVLEAKWSFLMMRK